MATSPIKLVFNRQDNTIVVLNGSAAAIPTLTQFNTPDFEIQIVDPAASQFGTTAPYILADMSAYSLRVAIGPQPIGNSGPTPWIVQTTWAYDAAVSSRKFSGSIPLTDSAIGTYIGAASSATGYFEVNLRQNGIPITVWQGTFIIRAALDEGTATTPSTADTYLTAAEVIARFLEKGAVAGEIKVWKSQDGTKTTLQYLDNDGTMHYEPLT